MLKRFLKWLRGDAAFRRSEKNHARYVKWLSEHAPDYATGKIELKRVKTTTDGINFYVPTDMLMMTVERKDKIQELSVGFNYGMTRGELQEFLESALDQVKELPYQSASPEKTKKFIERMRLELSEFLYRVKNIKTERIILEIAILIFHIEGENPYIINEVTQNRKRELIAKDDDLRAFFLQTTIVLLKQSINNADSASNEH
jgi:hypothetical protein